MKAAEGQLEERWKDKKQIYRSGDRETRGRDTKKKSIDKQQTRTQRIKEARGSYKGREIEIQKDKRQKYKQGDREIERQETDKQRDNKHVVREIERQQGDI